MASTVLGDFPADRPIAEAVACSRRRARAWFWRAALAGLSVFWIGGLAIIASRLF